MLPNGEVTDIALSNPIWPPAPPYNVPELGDGTVPSAYLAWNISALNTHTVPSTNIAGAPGEGVLGVLWTHVPFVNGIPHFAYTPWSNHYEARFYGKAPVDYSHGTFNPESICGPLCGIICDACSLLDEIANLVLSRINPVELQVIAVTSKGALDLTESMSTPVLDALSAPDVKWIVPAEHSHWQREGAPLFAVMNADATAVRMVGVYANGMVVPARGAIDIIDTLALAATSAPAPLPEASLDADAADGFGGPAPVWEEIGVAANVNIDRLANASAIRLFRWHPCEEVAGCEMAEFAQSELVGDKLSVQYWSTVHDNGVNVYAGIGLIRRQAGSVVDWIVVFTDAEGQAADGYRCRSTAGGCSMTGPAQWGTRFGVFGMAPKNTDLGVWPLVLGDLSSNVRHVSQLSTMSALGVGGGDGPHSMGTTRWVWRWVPNTSLLSFSNADGSDLLVFAKASANVPNISEPVSAGDLFLFPEELNANGEYGTRISSSDGIAPPTPYLVPGPGEYYGTPSFAHSHVAWLRATGLVAENKFEHVEVWASPYSADPSKLAPAKIGDTLGTSVHTTGIGGYGHYGLSGYAPGAVSRSVAIWNLNTLVRADRLTPSFAKSHAFLGVTRTHLWLTGSDPAGSNTGDYLFRFTVD